MKDTIDVALIFRVLSEKVGNFHILKLVDVSLDAGAKIYVEKGTSYPCPGYWFYSEGMSFVRAITQIDSAEFDERETRKKLVDRYSADFFYLELLQKTDSLFHSIVSSPDDLQKCRELTAENKPDGEKSVTLMNNIEQVYKSVSQAVIGQNEAIKSFLTAIYKNEILKKRDFPSDFVARNKSNILICGPTGTGKTEMIRRISRHIKVPYVIEDATRYTEAGYMGEDIDDIIRNLYIKAGKDKEKAESGIIILDEIDKLATNPEHRGSVSTKSVQQALLKMIEGEEYNVKLNHRDEESRFSLDTSGITFIGLGAFVGIENFSGGEPPQPEHFVDYGMIPELMGRLTSVLTFNALSEADLINILTQSTISPLRDYEMFFNRIGVKFSYDDEFIRYVAEKAVVLNKGARSLKSIIENALSDQLYDVFARNASEVVLKMQLSGAFPSVIEA